MKTVGGDLTHPHNKQNNKMFVLPTPSTVHALYLSHARPHARTNTRTHKHIHTNTHTHTWCTHSAHARTRFLIESFCGRFSAVPTKADQWEYSTAAAQKAETNQETLLAQKDLLIATRQIATSVSEHVAEVDQG